MEIKQNSTKKFSNIKNFKINYSSYHDYYLIKDNIIFKFIICKRNNIIIIKSNNYITKLDNNDLSRLNKSLFNEMDKAYKLIIDAFEENKVLIKNIIIKKEIKIYFKYDFDITLKYDNDNNLFLNEMNDNYTELQKDINFLKNLINELKNEIDQLKLSNNNKNEISCSKINIKNNLDKNNINLFNYLSLDSYCERHLDNSFTIFKSINDLLYLIYSNENHSIISYNLIDNKKYIEIKNAHDNYIQSFRHYLDDINQRDLIISISIFDNNIKLWDITNFNCLANIKNITKKGDLDSACFLKNNNQIFIISSHNYITEKCFKSDNIKIFNLKGDKINEINNSNDRTVFIDSYYDKKLAKNFIITGNLNYVKSYDFNSSKMYKVYSDGDNYFHRSAIIIDNDRTIKLIESSGYGIIRIWNFHFGILLKKLHIFSGNLFGICLWNKEYLFVGCEDNEIKLIELINGNIVMNIKGHNEEVNCIKKIEHPLLGECLVSQSKSNSHIKLWIIQKKN